MGEAYFTDEVGEWSAVLDVMIERDDHPYRNKKLREIRQAIERLREPVGGSPEVDEATVERVAEALHGVSPQALIGVSQYRPPWSEAGEPTKRVFRKMALLALATPSESGTPEPSAYRSPQIIDVGEALRKAESGTETEGRDG